ncbi:MAG: LemA family protein [Candidatus Aenigmarchaeota archaeon]|nr:LemA family protein [Candidatus Aenigmarchaeota archaeon]
MNKNLMYALGAVALVVIVVVLWFISTYNGLIYMNEDVTAKWQQVEVQYQRRADLIPNLVNTVKGYADFEQTVITDVTEARSAWMNAKTPEAQVQAANGLESALSRLLVTVENYPDLKASASFLSLQDELAGTENRVAVERGRYNTAVRDFNAAIKFFPANIVAGMLGYNAREYFESREGTENAPVVEF